MAIKKTRVQTCPECGAFFDTEIYAVVNGTLDHEICKEVMRGRIFDFTCPICNHRFRSSYSMAYRDMEKEYVILLDIKDTEEGMSEEGFIKHQIEETLELFPTYRIRVVNDMMDLIEKIYIFNTGLNDKIITYLGYKIKDDITVKTKNAKQSLQVHKALFDSLRGKEGVVNFGLLSTSPKPIFVSTPIKDYEYLLKKSPMRHKFDEADGLYQIDETWALGIDKALIA